MKAKVSTAICLALTPLVPAACADTDSASQSASATSSAPNSTFPYPPLQFRWDIAVPLGEQEKAAANFALETAAMSATMKANKDSSLRPKVNSRVGYENRPLPDDGIKALPETGGYLFRAVSVQSDGNDRWAVTYCWYNTPGAYTSGDNGELKLSDTSGPYGPYTAYKEIVALTSEKSGTGESSKSPRLLVVGESSSEFQQLPGQTNDLPRQTCEPFQPNPFIQQPPAPLPTGK